MFGVVKLWLPFVFFFQLFCLFLSSLLKKNFLVGYLVSCFSHFLCLMLILLFKWPPIVVKCHPVFLNARRLWCVLQRKCVLDKCHWGVIVLLAMSSVNKSSIDIKRGVFNRNTHKRRLYIDLVGKNNVTGGLQEPNSVFP